MIDGLSNQVTSNATWVIALVTSNATWVMARLLVELVELVCVHSFLAVLVCVHSFLAWGNRIHSTGI